MEYLGDIRVLVDLCLKVLFQYELYDGLSGKNSFMLFYYELLNRQNRKDNFEVVSYPTIISTFVLRYQWLWSDSLLHVEGQLYDPIMLLLLRDCASESTDPRPHFEALQYCLWSLLSIATLLFLFIQIIKIYFYHPYYTFITISSPNQCTYIICHCIGCVGDTRDFLFGCRVV